MNQQLKNIKIKKTYNFVWCFEWVENWFLILREAHRLKVFENRVLWGIFGHEKQEVTGVNRKLHSDMLHDLYCSSDIIRVIHAVGIDRTCSMHEKDEKAIQKLRQKPEEQASWKS